MTSVLLLVLVVLTETIALVCDCWLVRHIYTTGRSQEAWGGLKGWRWNVWAVTFLLSSIGVTWSFILLLEAPSFWIPYAVLIFASMNLTRIIFDISLVSKREKGVFITIHLLLIFYFALTVFTSILFPPTTLNLQLLLFCNIVCMIHACIDVLVWFPGWRDY
jgi:hypothetical protein